MKIAFSQQISKLVLKKRKFVVRIRSDCGGLKGINNNIQCIQYLNGQCVEFTLDKWVKNHYVLDSDKMKCKLKEKKWGEYHIDMCAEFGKIVSK